MQEIREEISEETYNKYARMTDAAVWKEIRATIPWVFGYKYYAYCLTKSAKGKFYIVHRFGGSCD